MSPSIVQLERFVRSARSGTYSAAADELYVSPQAVSKSVHDMEDKLHLQLFECEGKRLRPTPIGGAVLRYASEALDSIEQIRLISGEGDLPKPVSRGRIDVAVACSPLRGSTYGERDFERFRHMYPQVELNLSFCAGSTCLAALGSGGVDAAIVIGPVDDERFDSARVRVWWLSLLVSRKSSVAARGFATLADLGGFRLAAPYDFRCCKEVVSARLAERGIEPRFTSLEMRVDRHLGFLRDEGGAMLVVADERLGELFPGCVAVPFAACDRIALPAHFAWRKDAQGPWPKLLANYLRVCG